MEGESDKIFLMLLNEVKNLDLKDSNIISCKSKDKLSKEVESIKEYLKAKNICIIFDSGKQTEKTKQNIKKQLQKTQKKNTA